jgi:hypothetical protein
MKVNTSCVLKYLKHDYKEISANVVILLGLCVAAVVVIFTVLHVPQIIGMIFSQIPKILLPSAYILLNVVAGIVVLIFTVGVAVFGNKEWFKYKPWKEGYGWGRNDFEPKGSGVLFTPAFSIGFSVYIFYWIEYLIIGDWEDPTFSTIIFISLILIGTPMGCAIARCKEE